MSAEELGANDEGRRSDESGPGNESGPRDEHPPSADDIETPFFTRTIGPSSSLAGSVVGVYRLIQLLGHGGMGEV